MKTTIDVVAVLTRAGWSSQEINRVLKNKPAEGLVPSVPPPPVTWQPIEKQALYDVYDI